MAAGERNESSAAVAAPLLAAARERKLCKEGCPGCRLDEINKSKTGIPYLNFFYVWVVCLCAGWGTDLKTKNNMSSQQAISIPSLRLGT
ncbi:unnamed protein product [Triticum turgidum subsp. durum]|uniref:Uncharacterized protein n=1 Tax=Triticum turgidum subsp. durum TaxID=4567 RepID=A0A9R1QEZ2_TRITD|nr:unnamed protein product [Triticum turgidum subsp. durum]